MKTFGASTRDPVLDVLRGIAIFLVLLGHAVQYGSGTSFLQSGSFFDASLFKWIYSFHMPLFMIMSGYLFSYTVGRHSFSRTVKRRLTQLLLPIFAWNALVYVVAFARSPSWWFLPMAKDYLLSSLSFLWFLWALLFCSLLVAVVNRYLRDSILVYIAVFVALFFVPDVYNTANTKFMYPFFVIAYLYNQRQWAFMDKWNVAKKSYAWTLLAIVFTGLVVIYNRNDYIYTSGYTLLGRNLAQQFGIDMYRLAVGLVGSMVVILAVYGMRDWVVKVEHGVVSGVGRASLGIYVVSTLLFLYFVPRVTGGLHPQYYLAPLEAVGICATSYAATRVLSTWKVTRLLLLGGRGVEGDVRATRSVPIALAAISLPHSDEPANHEPRRGKAKRPSEEPRANGSGGAQN